MKLSLLRNLLKSERGHKCVCPKTGFEMTTPTEGCIKCIEKAAKREEEVLFVSADRHLIEFARSKIKKRY